MFAVAEDPSNLEAQLAQKFWDWMEGISWFDSSKDLYTAELEPELGGDFAAQVETPGGGRQVLLIAVKSSIRPSEVKARVGCHGWRSAGTCTMLTANKAASMAKSHTTTKSVVRDPHCHLELRAAVMVVRTVN